MHFVHIFVCFKLFALLWSESFKKTKIFKISAEQQGERSELVCFQFPEISEGKWICFFFYLMVAPLLTKAPFYFCSRLVLQKQEDSNMSLWILIRKKYSETYKDVIYQKPLKLNQLK